MSTHTNHTSSSSSPTYLVVTGVGRDFVWKYRRLQGVSYERRPAGRSAGGWWLEIESRDARRGTMCPTHHIQRTPSGVCDQCDD